MSPKNRQRSCQIQSRQSPAPAGFRWQSQGRRVRGLMQHRLQDRRRTAARPACASALLQASTAISVMIPGSSSLRCRKDGVHDMSGSSTPDLSITYRFSNARSLDDEFLGRMLHRLHLPGGDCFGILGVLLVCIGVEGLSTSSAFVMTFSGVKTPVPVMAGVYMAGPECFGFALKCSLGRHLIKSMLT